MWKSKKEEPRTDKLDFERFWTPEGGFGACWKNLLVERLFTQREMKWWTDRNAAQLYFGKTGVPGSVLLPAPGLGDPGTWCPLK